MLQHVASNFFISLLVNLVREEPDFGNPRRLSERSFFVMSKFLASTYFMSGACTDKWLLLLRRRGITNAKFKVKKSHCGNIQLLDPPFIISSFFVCNVIERMRKNEKMEAHDNDIKFRENEIKFSSNKKILR